MSTAHPQGDLTRAGRVCPTQLPSVGRGPLPASAKTSRPAVCILEVVLWGVGPQKGKGQELFLGAAEPATEKPGLRRKTPKKKVGNREVPSKSPKVQFWFFLEARKPTGGGVKKSESTLSGFLEGQKSTGGPVKKSKSTLLEFLAPKKAPNRKKGAK